MQYIVSSVLKPFVDSLFHTFLLYAVRAAKASTEIQSPNFSHNMMMIHSIHLIDRHLLQPSPLPFQGVEVSMVSRGDSTLRGHFPSDLISLEAGMGLDGEWMDNVSRKDEPRSVTSFVWCSFVLCYLESRTQVRGGDSPFRLFVWVGLGRERTARRAVGESDFGTN